MLENAESFPQSFPHVLCMVSKKEEKKRRKNVELQGEKIKEEVFSKTQKAGG